MELHAPTHRLLILDIGCFNFIMIYLLQTTFIHYKINKINLDLFPYLQFALMASPTSQGKPAVKLCTLFLGHTAPTRQNAGELKSPSLILA